MNNSWKLLSVLLVLSVGWTWNVRAEDAQAVVGSGDKPWKFDIGNRRDPFVFVPNVEVKEGPKTPPLEKSAIPPATHYADAAHAFLEQNRDDKLIETLEKCDAGLKALSEDPNAAGDPLAQDLRERLIDLRKAAQRVMQRKDVERRFKTIPIRLTGIVRRDHGSQAIVNSRAVRKGDVVASANDSAVVLDEIRADEIVVVFEGYRMLLNLADHSK